MIPLRFLVGARRWQPPAPLPRWQGVRVATGFSPACVQPQGGPVSVYTEARMPVSEDCLTLNIWMPALAKKLRSSSGSTAARC